jgi:tetratricopeptide (TPR) repeat protein
MATLEEWGIGARLAQACYGLAFYAWKTLWPAKLNPMHELPWRFDPSEPRFVVGIAVVVVLGAAVILLWKHAPWLAAAAAIYAITLAPVLGFNQAGPQLVAERYSYVARLPWAAVFGGALLALWSRGGAVTRVASGLSVLALLGALFAASRRQTPVWRDDETLWRYALAVGPPTSFAENSLGAAEFAQGRTDSALARFRRSVEIRPDQGVAWFNLGMIAAERGRYAEAEHALLQAKTCMTPAYKPLSALGKLYMERMDRLDDALRVMREAMEDMRSLGFRWFHPVPHLVYGTALKRKGLLDEARQHLQIAASYPETRAEALQELARKP